MAMPIAHRQMSASSVHSRTRTRPFPCRIARTRESPRVLRSDGDQVLQRERMVGFKCVADLVREQSLDLVADHVHPRLHAPGQQQARRFRPRLDDRGRPLRAHRQTSRSDVEFGRRLRRPDPPPYRVVSKRLFATDQGAAPSRQPGRADRHDTLEFDVDHLRRRIEALQPNGRRAQREVLQPGVIGPAERGLQAVEPGRKVLGQSEFRRSTVTAGGVSPF